MEPLAPGGLRAAFFVGELGYVALLTRNNKIKVKITMKICKLHFITMGAFPSDS